MLEFVSKKYAALSGFDQHFSNISSPSRLVLQIVTLQLFYYFTALVLFFITAKLIGQPFDAGWVFSWQVISIENSLGFTLIILWLFDSLLCVIFIMLVIGRSKLAWDFAVTVHVINLFCAWMYEGFPKNLSWWALQVMSSLIMVSLGTYTTRWKELRDTFFDGLIDAELGQSNAMMGDMDQNDNEESEGVRNTIPMKNMTKV